MITQSKNGISVIIPTYNRASFLYPTLLCLSNQIIDSSLDYEVIVIDSGNDESRKIVEFFASKNPKRFIYKKIRYSSNRALLRNKGAILSKFNLLFFLDNDMLIPSDYLQQHYNAHNNKERLIVCGRRKTLTDFDISNIGTEILLNSFSKLDLLPWYDDERLKQNLKLESWRYVYTHSLSVKKDFFFKVGGLTSDFGNVWGGEDIELSYKLFQIGATFHFLLEPAIYHQGHFSQSAKEQQSSISSSRLFAKLHNSYNSELFLCYPTITVSDIYEDAFRFIEDYHKKNKQIYLSKSFIREFNLILAYISDSACENIISPKTRLGAFLPHKNKSLDKVLVLHSIFDFPTNIQDCIFSEAVRVSKNIYFEKESKREQILNMIKRCGYNAKIEMVKNYKKIELTNYKGNGVIQFTLPDLYSPQKRFIFLSLAAKLLEYNKRIVLWEKRNSEYINDEEMGLEYEIAKKLNKCFRLHYGTIPTLYITPYSNTAQDTIQLIPNIPQNFIILDENYFIDNNSYVPTKFNKCTILSNKFFSSISFSIVYNKVQEWEKQKMLHNPKEQNNILTFMENGYFEDSMEEILDAFFSLHKQKNLHLIIKMPNYITQLENAYPFHNQSSKKHKNVNYERKIINDKFLLMNKIRELGLEDRITILNQNYKFSEIITLISNSKYVIELSKILNPGPEIYAGLLLKKTVIIPYHFVIPDELQKFFIRIPSKTKLAADCLRLPTNSQNLHYKLFEIETQQLITALNKKYKQIAIRKIILENLNKKYKQILNYLIM